MQAIYSSKISVSTHETTRCQDPEDYNMSSFP